MAIYHFSMKTVSRSAGRSAVAAAAYRAGQKLEDHFYGLTHNYTKKKALNFREFTPRTNAIRGFRTVTNSGILQSNQRIEKIQQLLENLKSLSRSN